jgi:hypothetical protein
MWDFGITISPMLCGITAAESYSYLETESSLSFAVAGDVYASLSKNISLRSGISWHAGHHTYKDQSGRWPSDVVNGEFVPGHGGNYYLFDIVEHSVDVPLMLVWHATSEKKTRFRFDAGVRFRQLITTSGNYALYEGHQVTHEGDIDNQSLAEQNKFKIAGSISAGFETRVGKSELGIMPVLEIPFTKLYKEEPVVWGNGKVMYYGISVSLR